jgi:hypothetical protein
MNNDKQLKLVQERTEKARYLYALCEVDQLILSLIRENKTPAEIRFALKEEIQNTVIDINVLLGFKIY